MILDNEFKRFKTAEIREEIRQAYDNEKAKLHGVETTISMERGKNADDKSKLADGDIARLDDEVVRIKKSIEGYENQMRNLDIEVNGASKSNDFPDGYQGINQLLESLRELVGMLKDYIKRL